MNMANESKYSWIRSGFAKGIEPDEAIRELERIEANYGALTPENILDASKSEDALFHSLFTWDDNQAAHNYRLQEARVILNNIEIKVVSDGSEKRIPVFEVIKNADGRAYKHIESFTKEDILQVKSESVKAFNYWKNKLSIYKEFDQAIIKIDEVISELK